MYKSKSKHSVVNEYFRLIPERKVAPIAALFAADAIVMPSPLPPSGPVKGAPAIVALYEAMLSVQTRFVELRMYDESRSCAVEITAEIGEERRILEVVDIFDVNDEGKITRMSVYKR